MMKYSMRQKRPGKRRQGTGLVEFALVAPLLLAIMLGIIDFGLLGRATLTVANAAREGARAASVGQSTSNIYTRVANAGAPTLKTNASGQVTNGSIVMQQAVYAGVPVYIAWPADSGSGTDARNSVAPGNYVRITVNCEYRSLTGVLTRTISVPVVMRREG